MSVGGGYSRNIEKKINIFFLLCNVFFFICSTITTTISKTSFLTFNILFFKYFLNNKKFVLINMSDSKKNSSTTSSSSNSKNSSVKGSASSLNKDNDNRKDDHSISKDKQLGGTQVVDLGFLEADDDFEEFQAEEWKEKLPGDSGEEDTEQVNIWEDNWDDDNIEEDFSKQLK